jgi:cation:H+ antiporter
MDWVLGLPSHLAMIGLFLVAGGVGLPVGASLMVEAAVEIAGRFGVSDTVVGLTVVAFGTSLPELATTAVAALQRRTDVVVGTIIGSNTFNILAIMGIGAAASPVPIDISERLLTLDLPVMLAASAVLTICAVTGRKIRRGLGALLLGGYVSYMVVLFTRV